MMRKLLKSLVWLGVLAGIALLALRYVALPYAERRLQTALREAGLPQAVLERRGVGLYDVGYILRPQPGAEPMARLSLLHIHSLVAQTLFISDLTVKLDGTWQVPGYVATGPAAPAVTMLEHKLPPVPVDVFAQGSIETPAGEFHFTADLKPGAVRISYYTDKGNGEVTVTRGAAGQYSLAFVGEYSGMKIDALVQAGRAEPVISATVKLTKSPVAAIGGDIILHLNEGQKAGYALPFTVATKIGDKPAEVKGTLDIASLTARGTLSADIKQDGLEAVGITGSFELISLYPPVVKNGAVLEAKAVQIGGLPLIAPRMTYGFRSNTADIQSATAGLFGGRVSLAPVRLAVPPRRAEVKLDFDSLDLSQVLQLAAVDGLGGDGKLSGSVPVTFENGRITLGEAQLRTAGSGQIHYAPVEKPAFLASGGSGEMLGQVFSDFRYTGLTVTLGGTLGDNLTLGARLEGSNPSFYDGHSVAFNLNLSGALESLLTKGLQSFQFTPEAIKQMTEEGHRP